MTVPSDPTSLDWLLDELLNRLPGAERAIVLSGDGMLIGRSSTLDRDNGEHLAAVASGMQGLARGASRQFDGGPLLQVIVEMGNSYLVVTEAGVGASLAVLAAVNTDLGLLAYEMNLLVKQVGAYLTARPRFSGAGSSVDPGAYGRH
jgi:predicted regulator of Ras-like GTPase activity (Roadblock/LC7/MglB family)